jgi:protein O-mannosyl-transferase
MMPTHRNFSRILTLACAVVLFAAVSWIYWPGIHGPELLDDRSSVMVIKELEKSPELAWDYVFGDRSGPMGRTVSMGTFVLEKLYFDAGILGNKRVNIVLHIVNGGVLAWLFLLLFRQQGVSGYRGLALGLAAIWLVHPLWVSTVLYAVQRMTMLATLCMLLAAISYIYWRSRWRQGTVQWVGAVPVVVFTLLGVFCKENAALIVPVILLMEVFWFQFLDSDGAPLKRVKVAIYTLIAGGGVALIGILVFNWGYILSKYAKRPFTFEERVLTQFRALWDYVYQWFFPQIERMGIYHDDLVWSQSLTQPLTTLLSILGWLAVLLISALLLRFRDGRLLVFAIAWFLVGHSLESSLWALELYFEHRNYFPAIGLVLFLGVFCAGAIKRWPEVKAPIFAWLAVVAIVLSIPLSSLVQVWSSQPMLILHHLNGHPMSSRANLDMAVQVAQYGSADKALAYSRKGFEVSTIEREGDLAVRNIALLCMMGKPVYPSEIDRIGQSDERRPLSSVTTLLTLTRMIQDDRCPQLDKLYFADRLAKVFLEGDRPAGASANMYSNMAVLENSLGRFDRAYAYTERLLKKKPRMKRALLMQLHFSSALGKDDVASGLIEVLQGLDEEGKLTLKERQTLALYLEN